MGGMITSEPERFLDIFRSWKPEKCKYVQPKAYLGPVWSFAYLIRVPSQSGGWLALRKIPQDNSLISRSTGQHISKDEKNINWLNKEVCLTMQVQVAFLYWKMQVLRIITWLVCSKINPTLRLCVPRQALLLLPAVKQEWRNTDKHLLILGGKCFGVLSKCVPQYISLILELPFAAIYC